MRRYVLFGNAVMLVLFVFWAGFQYNDPDGLLWMAVYGAAAIECVLYFMNRFPRALAWFYGALCAIWAVVLAAAVAIDGEFIFEERGREMMGLVICALWTALLLKLPRQDVRTCVRR